jgi:aryl-alcohol dehydrogenase-like predicted oxidoreductase
MKYNRLGNTGLRVSEICLGAMTFGENGWNIGELGQAGADEMTQSALAAGVNFFDTADVYAYGESEEILGRALKNAGGRRDSYVIATKVLLPMSAEAWQGTGDFLNRGLSRQHVMAACDASLRRLGTDYIDLYQVHGFDLHTPIEETLNALNDLARSGKVRYIACSNWAARHIAKALGLSQARGWEKFVSLQAYYSLANRDLEHDLLPLCREENLGLLVWSPLSGGFLSGKYRRDAPQPEGARRVVGWEFPPIDERGFDAVDALLAIAQAKNATPAQVALAWLRQQTGVTSIIIGAKKMSQLEDNLQCVNITLTDEELAQLSATTAPAKMYPAWMYEMQNQGM